MSRATSSTSGMLPAAAARAEQRRNRYRARRRARAATGAVVFVAAALAYGAAAYHVVFGLHIGHVVQDGVDTGDALAVPLLLMAGLCVILAVACMDRFSRLSPRYAAGYAPRQYVSGVGVQARRQAA